jgi:hypothetical protein
LNDIPEILKHALAPFAPPEVAEVTKTQTGGSTTYRIVGNDEAVERAVIDIMREYPSLGYGTSVAYFNGGAIVSRANSCD